MPAVQGQVRQVRAPSRSPIAGWSASPEQVQDLPGQNLFQYQDDEGEFHPIHSSDVNAYLRETMGEDYTAKEFRTWRASVLAFRISEAGGRRAAAQGHACACVRASRDTPAIARKSTSIRPWSNWRAPERGCRLPAKLPRATRWLSADERGFLAFLQPCKRRSDA